MLYERLKNECCLFCMGKKNSALIASCRYIEGMLGLAEQKTETEISREYGISDSTIRKHSKTIVILLKLEDKGNWRWKKNQYYCTFCGEIFSAYNEAYWCSKCRIILSICQAWEKANMCICCGELNPFFQLKISGHHIFGVDNSDISIPICANCHELTKPRLRQGFFLFKNRPIPLETKFTEDNSRIYIHIS
jgi:hypothetical protein